MSQPITDQYPQWTQRLVERWEEICKICVIRTPDIAALLCNASPVAVVGKEGEFVLFIQVEYTPHLAILAAPASYQVVEGILQRIYDPVTIYVRFIGKESTHGAIETETTPSTQLASLPPSPKLTPLQEILNLWDYIKRACKLKSPKAAVLLSEATPKAVIARGTRELVLEVTSEDAYQRLSTSRYRGIGEWAVHAVVGSLYRIRAIHQGDSLPAQDVQEARDLQQLVNQWDQIHRACKMKSHKVAALLNDVKPVALIGTDGQEVVLRVEFDFHFNKLSEPDLHHIVVQAVNDVVGMPYRVRLIRKDDPIPTT